MAVVTVLVSWATACAVRLLVHWFRPLSGMSCSMSSTSSPAAWMKRPVYSTAPGGRAISWASGDGGQGGEVAAGAEDDDGDARAGQAGCGCGQVAAGGCDALGDQDRGLAVAGASGPAEGDGVGGGELVQSSDDVVEEFLGALRVVVAHVRPSGNEAVGAVRFCRLG